MQILITGGLGWTAQAIIKTLAAAGHEVITLDLPARTPASDIAPLLAGIQQGSVVDFEQVMRAMQGVEAIIHLAVAVGDDDYKKADVPFQTNVQGTYHVFEAARRAGAQKVLLMGSAPVHLPARANEKLHAVYDYRCDPGDDFLYDLTKHLQERIARDFAETFDMQVTTLRAGHIVDGRARVDMRGQPLRPGGYGWGGWVCRYDIAQAYIRALGLTHTGYQAFHVIGAYQARQHYDIERTEQDLGLVCAVQFEDYE